MQMNLKALITTLVLGSSSMAAADSYKVSGSVSVSLGGHVSTRPAPAPVYPVYRPTPSRPVARPVVVVNDADCHDPHPAPAYHAPGYRPMPAQPVWNGAYFNITNNSVGANASQYQGWMATSPVRTAAHFNGNGFVATRATHNWFDLTEATRIDSGRQFFTVGADNGKFRALKLQALGNGSSKIEQITIEYLDATGQAKFQKIKPDTFIHRNNPTITIDLDGGYRSIGRIIVYGATDRGSAYKLQAL
jgi:hypothetical protein